MAATSRRIGFALLPLLGGLALGEVGLRLAGWPTVEAAFEHNEPFWRADPDLRQAPFSHRELGVDFPVSTNKDGLRTAHPSRDRAAGVWRIVTMGCSTTFGWGVTDSESWPQRLEARSQAAGTGPLEVINAGQPGYTSFQGRWLWSEVVASYEPDVVLLGFVVQDARRAAYSDKSQALLQADGRYLKDHLLYRSRLYLGLRAALGGVQLRAKERGQGQDEGGEYRVPPADYAENLRWLVDQSRAVGATPVLFGYPLEREGYTAAHRRILAAAAVELDVAYIDLQARMEQAATAETLYFPQDRGHANAAGNDRIAEWALDALKGLDLLGPR
jgi:lysophospholipase L1-like esterase